MDFKSRKGQYLTLEQLIIFAMGIVVLTTTAIAYNSARITTKTVTVQDQFTEVGELVLSNVVYAYTAGKKSHLDMEVLFDIPKELSSQAYLVNLTQNGIEVISFEDFDDNVTVSVGTINATVVLNGTASSPNGRAKINYNLSSNTILLGDI